MSPAAGNWLGELSWAEAAPLLTNDRVILWPLGAGAKEHGLHLPLANDQILAERLAERVRAARDVLVLPTLTYGFYPAFVDYPGSTSISPSTQRALVVDVCRSLARHGARRFYVLNTGISTLGPLRQAQNELRRDGLLFAFSEPHAMLSEARTRILEQPFGSHADEGETSMMLELSPDVVHLELARPELAPDRPGPLTRDPTRLFGVPSETGAWGDPTRATADKGRVLVEALLRALLQDIDDLSSEPPAGASRSL